MLTWTEVSQVMAPWRNYWVGTTGLDGAPHGSPVWGVVVGEELYFYTERDTVKARNMRADPRIVIHLESADDVVIVRGAAELLGAPRERPDLIAAFAVKYPDPGDAQYLPAETDVLNEFYAVRPRTAMVWLLDAYESSQRRWTAPPA